MLSPGLLVGVSLFRAEIVKGLVVPVPGSHERDQDRTQNTQDAYANDIERAEQLITHMDSLTIMFS